MTTLNPQNPASTYVLVNLNQDQAQQLWEQAKAFAREAIRKAFEQLPGVDGTARENFALDLVMPRIEAVDHLLPVIGAYMDLPLVDWAQREAVRQIIRALVRREYAAQQIKALQEEKA